MRARPTTRQWIAVPAICSAVAGFVLAATHWGGGESGLAPTWAVVLGPLAGGFVREWQSCCAQFSLGLLPVALAMWAPGVAVAFLVPPTTKARRALRWTLWVAGWFAWFFAAPFSYLHALE